MSTLRQVLAFPMYATVAWLLWVLAQQTAPSGFAAVLAGIVLVALAAWAYRKATEGGRIAAVVAIAALIAAIGLPLGMERANVAATSPAAAARGWLPYDPARIALLRAQARPVLVDFTAKWCLTCLVNERTVFADPAVRAFLRDRGVTLVRADWTDGDPRITRALARFGRAGVPLYVVYNGIPGSRRALILPQLLTARIVEDTLAALPARRPP